MKYSVFILVLISSMTFSFAKSTQVFGQTSIADESPKVYAIQEYQANADLSHYSVETKNDSNVLEHSQ